MVSDLLSVLFQLVIMRTSRTQHVAGGSKHATTVVLQYTPAQLLYDGLCADSIMLLLLAGCEAS
jgi:hypothetical protein